MNPVARRELQERFRTLRSPLLLSVWVLAIGVVTFLAYLYASQRADDRLAEFSSAGVAGFGSVVASSSMGRFMLHALLLGLLSAVVIVVPGQAAVTIVGEKERQTLQLLQVSQMSSVRIVIGKLLSAIAYILLLLVASTPLLVIPVLLGGVSVWDVLGGVGMVMAAAVLIGSISMWVSARAKSVQGAVLGSYVWAVALVAGTFALVLAEVLLLVPDDPEGRRIQNGVARTDGYEVYSAWLNPYMGMADASTDVLEFRPEIVTSPYGPLRDVLVARQGITPTAAASLYDPYQGLVGGDEPGFPRPLGLGPQIDFDLGGGAQIPIVGRSTGTTRTFDAIRSAVWWKTLVFELVVSVLTLVAAARLIRVPRRRFRAFSRRTADAT
ncbi:MAG TPA: ABC transporter permease subunit [Acidimicrobiia bacterium]|jgi:ABC-type transport system involved in multi-copper enzyme maturation permease subunit